MGDRYSRTRLLLGDRAMEALSKARVIVFGIGGVGGYVVEALARCGIGGLDLVDSDRVAESNLNRQIIATLDTVGMPKTRAARDRIRSVNPDCKVVCHDCFYLPDTRDRFDFADYDYVVDAVDTVTAKIDIILRAKEAGVPVISSMGAGNKLDPAAFRVCDIYETSVDPLARIMRRELRKRGVKDLKVVWSPEEPRKSDAVSEEEPGPGRRSVPASISFVPSAAGLIMASEIVRDLAGIPRQDQKTQNQKKRQEK